MPRLSANLPTADPGTVEKYTVDFTGYLPAGTTLQSATWALSVDRTLRDATADTSPTGHLIGSATADPTTNLSVQEIGGLVAGNDYTVAVTGTTEDGEEIVLWTVLPCRAAGAYVNRRTDRAAQLAAIEAARNSGALIVRHGDTQTTFRNLDEMDRIIWRLRREVYGNSPIRRVRLLATKGLC